MSTLEDKLAAGIAQVKNTSRTRKTPAKAAPAKTVAPSAAPTPAPTAAVKPVVTEAPKRVYLADERVWPD